jgi:pSer/pThr/pTyr-binding forkhead associated (FHA) protein
MARLQGSAGPRAFLAALTPESQRALGAAEIEMMGFPFRIGRESRAGHRVAPRVIAERRKTEVRTNNEVYLAENTEPFNVSREHLQIEHNGSDYILTDRQSTCGTLVEGRVIGGQHVGGAVLLHDGDVIIVGTSASRYIFKFRIK